MTESKFEVDYLLVEEWLTQKSKRSQMVDDKTKAILSRTLKVFKEVGPTYEELPGNRTKKLFDGIYEIKVGQYRLAYFWDDTVCVLLLGIKKKRDKWVLKDIELVKTRRKNYLNNK